MKFEFNVNVNDQDYLHYNMFWSFRSPYGKKQIKSLRIVLAVLFLISLLTSFFSDSFWEEVPLLVVLLLAQIYMTKIFSWLLKRQIKSMKKRGKVSYSPEAVISFYEDFFVETTPDNKTEQKYSAVERVSIVDNKMIYIHVNSMMAYMLPMACFESKEQYKEFLDFIGTKCANVDTY